MSTAAKFKALNEAVAAAGERIAQLEKENADLAKTLSDRDAELKVALDACQAEKAAGDAVRAELQTATDTANTTIGDLTQKLTDMTKKAEVAEMRLADPAFVDASAPGVETPATNGAPAATGENGKSLWDQYHAIKDPAEKTKFYNDHNAEMMAYARSAFRA